VGATYGERTRVASCRLAPLSAGSGLRMDEAADRARTAESAPPTSPARAPSDERIRAEKQHEEAEGIAVEGDDLSEIFESVLGRGRPHVGEAQPKGPWAWPPEIGHESERSDQPDPDPVDEDADENRCE